MTSEIGAARAAWRDAEEATAAAEEMMDYNEKWGGTTSRAMNWDDLVQKNIDAEAEIETLKLSLADRVEEVKSLKAEIGRHKTAIAMAMLNLRGQSLKFLGLNLNLNCENVEGEIRIQ